MGFALQLLPARVDGGAVLRELLGQAEQVEVAGLEVHFGEETTRATAEPALPGRWWRPLEGEAPQALRGCLTL